MPLSTGDKLGPPEILEPIGKGGMGEVYKADDPPQAMDDPKAYTKPGLETRRPSVQGFRA